MPPYLIRIAVVAVLAVFGGHLLSWWLNVRSPGIVSPFFVLSMASIIIGSFAALIGYIFWLAFWEREPNPTPRVKGAVRRYLTPEILGNRIAPLVLTFTFLGAFSTFKVLIPRVNAFSLDGLLSDLDRWMFGSDAWQLTHELIGPMGTRIIDFTYGLWFPAWSLAIIFFSLGARVELQKRFFVTFFGIWGGLGIGLATLLSSAGPCFLQLIGHPYAERYPIPLEHAPGAQMAQQMLTEAYLGGGAGFAKGISAMPSVHVAVAALMVVAARHYGRAAFASALVFYAMIFLGSVHLGWHYVSDGVIGTIGAVAIWVATRPRLDSSIDSAISGEALPAPATLN